MTEQPTALRLADALLQDSANHRETANAWDMRPQDTINWQHYENATNAAAELRRLHSVNAQLLDALDEIAINTHDDIAERVARAAIAAAKELL